MRQLARDLSLPGATFVLVLVLAACNALLPPTASLTPREQALRDLAAQQAKWHALAIDDYIITIERQCFCPGAHFEITVTDGIVTSVTKDTLPVRPNQVADLPKTVPELFALVASLPPASIQSIAYDVQLGFPTTIAVDPVANAVDDEYTIVVHDFRRA